MLAELLVLSTLQLSTVTAAGPPPKGKPAVVTGVNKPAACKDCGQGAVFKPKGKK